MSGEISYNSEVVLQKKRVLYEPVITTETLKEGYIVCYNNDRTTDLKGTTVSAGTTNPARFLQVEKPATGNLDFAAGVVCPSGEGAAYGDWVDIYLFNGADIPVYADQNCVNGTTTLAITNGSYYATAVGASNVNIGLAKDTINRTVPGMVLMRSYQPMAAASGYAALSAMLSTVSLACSAVTVSAMDDLSAAVSTNTSDIAEMSSLVTDVSEFASTESAYQSSIITDILLLSSLLTDVSEMASATSNTVSDLVADVAAESAMQSSIITDILLLSSLLTDVSEFASTVSNQVSAVKESAFSHISSLETTLSDAISAANSDIAEMSSLVTDVSEFASTESAYQSSIITDILLLSSLLTDVSEMASATSNTVSDLVADVAAESAMQSSIITDILLLSSLLTDVSEFASIESAYQSSVITDILVLSSLITDVSETDSATSALLSLVSNETSAVSNVASEARASVTVNTTEIDAVSDMQSSIITDIIALDNDATSSQASTKIVSTASILVGYKKITLADGTSFSCVAFVTSVS